MRVTCGADPELLDALLVVPAGKMDGEGAGIVLESTFDRLTPETPSLLVDMSQVPYMSSAGITALIRLVSRARELGGGMAIFGCRPAVCTVIRIVAIGSFLNVCDTAAEARDRLRKISSG